MSTTTRRLGAAVAMASAFAAAVVACGTSTTSSSGGTTTRGAAVATTARQPGATAAGPDEIAGPVGTAPGGGDVITVTLNEWKVIPSAATAKAGTITFTAENEGKEVHELLLVKTDLPPDKLPLDEEGVVDEKGQGVEFIDEVEDVQPGTTKSFTVENVAPGNYVLLCNLYENGERHYGHLMYTTFTVRS